MGVPLEEPPPKESTGRGVRRVLLRLAISGAALAALHWLGSYQPFYRAVITALMLPVGAGLLWWTWRAVRRASSDRRAAERRRESRRSPGDDGDGAGSGPP